AIGVLAENDIPAGLLTFVEQTVYPGVVRVDLTVVEILRGHVAALLPAGSDRIAGREWHNDGVLHADGVVVHRHAHALRPPARRQHQANGRRVAGLVLQVRVANAHLSPTLLLVL